MRKINKENLAVLIAGHTKKELLEGNIGCKEVIVHQAGNCVYSAVFGANPVGGKPLPPGKLYRAASMTKPVTVAAVLQLADKGLLSLDDDLSKYFPKAKGLKVAVVKDSKIVNLVPLEKEIKIRNLLSHTSGIGCHPLSEILECKNKTLSLDDAVEDILSKPLSFEPDSAQSYGTTEAFDIAAGIVQKVADCPFDEYLENNITGPLGMVNTTFRPTNAQWEKVVVMHNRTKDGKSENASNPAGCVFENFLAERMPAGAGLVTTAQDYIKFADMLCLAGKTGGKQSVLSENAVNLMSTPHLPANFENWCEKWGLGVRIVVSDDYPHGLPKGSFGWSGAYGTHFWVDRKNGISAVMMKNSLYDGGSGNKSACQLEQAVYDSLE